jgi:hypothetical protein
MFSQHLPKIYQQNDGAKWLHQTADTIGVDIDKQVEALRDFLDPAMTTERGLNFIATEILDLKAWFWSDSWSIEWKRKTIQNYPKLIKERGNRGLLPWLFNLYGLEVTIQTGGWVLGVTVFPIQFGTNWDQLSLKIPSYYLPSSVQYQMIELIKKYFIPDLIRVSLVY